MSIPSSFFDPDADTPTAMDPDVASARFAGMFDELIDQADEIGIDPALLKASRDLGYIVTTENQHLFSAADIQAWQDTVQSYQEDDVEFDEDDPDLADLLDLLTGELTDAVAATIAQRSAEPARVFAARVLETDIAVGGQWNRRGRGSRRVTGVRHPGGLAERCAGRVR